MDMVHTSIHISTISGIWKEGILQKDQKEKRLDNDSSRPVMEARQDNDGLISTPKQTIKVIG